MTSIFISYSRKNQEFAEELRDQLNKWSYSVWIDVDGIPKGERWTDEIQKALENSDIVIGVMSPSAVESVNVKNEWDWAKVNEKPLLLLRIKPTNVPMNYISDNYIDFVSDKEKGFNELRKDLINRFALEPSSIIDPAVRNHVERYWKLARQFFIQADYALALFFAITLIDETGKMVLLGVPHHHETFGLEKPSAKKISKEEQERFEEMVDMDVLGTPREMVIRMTMPVNSRVARIYKEEDRQFGEWFREKKFPQLLKDSLSMSGSGGDVKVPSKTITRFEAFTMVCIAGEIYAEVQGQFTGVRPTEWERILKEIDDFREKYQQ